MSKKTNQIKRIAAQEHGYLASLVPKHMSSPSVLLTIKITLCHQVKIVIHRIIIVLLRPHQRRRCHIRHPSRRGSGGIGGGGSAKAAADAGAPTLESSVRRGVLRGVLLYSQQLLRCPSKRKKSRKSAKFRGKKRMGVWANAEANGWVLKSSKSVTIWRLNRGRARWGGGRRCAAPFCRFLWKPLFN